MFIRTDGGDAVLVATNTGTHVTLAVAETDVGQHEVCLPLHGGEITRLIVLLRQDQNPYEGLVLATFDVHGRELTVLRETPGSLLIRTMTDPDSPHHCTWMVDRNGADIGAVLATYLQQCRTEVEGVA